MEISSNGEMIPKTEAEQEILRDERRYNTVYIPQSASNCSVGFEEQKEFIVFSKGHGIFQQTTKCAGSNSVNRSKKLIQTLDQEKSL